MSVVPIEDRLAIEDAIIGLASAIDSMDDGEAVAAAFVDEGIYDLSTAGLGAFTGHAAIRGFFAAAWSAHSHFAHVLSNFAITAFAGDTASAQVYATGHALTKAGERSAVLARYRIDLVRTGAGWKIARHTTGFLLPPG
jgi:ketosteroid isomerase-like protein